MAGSVRKKRANRKTVRLVVLVTLVLVSVLTVRIVCLSRENRALAGTAEALQESLQEEEAKHEALKDRMSRDLTVDEIIEIARERFGLLFKNEILFVPKD